MIVLQLSREDAAVLREILQARLIDLAREINRTDHLDSKKSLQHTEQILDGVVRQLDPSREDAPL
jgi:hypothetical protein